jgi:hypothetical protein
MSAIYRSALPLDDLRPILESTAAAHGVVLDFLMQRWNGRFATYNVGIPTDTVEDARRGVRDEARHYRLLGRIKANTQAAEVTITLNPPSACDVSPSASEQAQWDAFVAALVPQFQTS